MSDYAGRIISATEPTVTTTSASGVWTVEEALKYKKAGTWPTFTPDPNFKQTVLLLHGDGTNGAQNNTFLDSSTNNFTITRNGNTTQGTFSPFSVGAGEWSNYFDGSGDYLSSPNNSAIHVLGSDFCLEGWFYLNTAPANYGLYSTYSDNSTGEVGGYIVRLDSTYFRFFYFADSSGTNVVIDRTFTFSQGQWHHFAVTVSSGTGRIFINGVQQGATFTVSSTQNSTKSLQIGRTHTLTNDFPGYFSNFRVVKGSAVYTSNFTPSTTPLTAITNTSLLTCQSNRFVDNSTNAFTITRNGDVRVTPFSPFAPTAEYSAGTNGGSGYFDGSGDYLSVADNAAFDLSGDFTIEFVAYATGANNRRFLQLGDYRSANNGLVIYTNASNALVVYVNGATIITGSAFPLNQWVYVALVRSGGGSNNLKLYMNAVQDGQATNTVSFTGVAGNGVAIGAEYGGSYTATAECYISTVRIVNGTALTPAIPTAPLTAITNTSLLLNFTNAGIIDNTGKNVLETVGNAQIDTAVKKYGTGSLEFDGTGDWLLVPNSPDNQLGTGNFTIEFWVYLNATGVARGFVGKGGASTGWLVSLVSTNTVRFTYGSSTITSTGTLSGSTWHHIAVVREGTGTNQTKIYINGTNDGTGTVSTDFNQTEVMYIGANRTGGDALNGFIDDLRITKGVARYTANFTAPTAPFLDQ